MCDKSGTDLLSGHCDGSFPALLSGQLAARKNSRVVRWYVLTLPVCHRGPAPGLRQEQERRLRSGEPPFEFFAPSYVEVRHENGRPVNTRRPLLYNYVFIRSSENELFRLKRQLPQYNFLPRVRDGREEYYPYLSDEAMRNLRWVARAYSDELPVYVPDAPQPVKGDRVRITSGRFKGVEARVAVRPGGGRREIVVCVENWMWVPLLHVRPGEYEVIGLHEAGKRVYESLDNDRLLEGLHGALGRHHGPEGATDDDRALAGEALRLCGGLRTESDVLRSKLQALLLPAYTILVEKEALERLLGTVREQLSHVKAEQSRALLLVTLYGCTGSRDCCDRAHAIIDGWRKEPAPRKSKRRLMRWLEDFDRWLGEDARPEVR